MGDSPVNERALGPNEFALLGILRVRGPLHGYEMARSIARDLADVCPTEQSTLYTYLRALEGRGMVAWHEERVGQNPPRKVFALTGSGREAVDEWLARPVARIREVRLDFLLKLNFLGQQDPAAERALIAAQIVECEAYLRGLEARAANTRFGRMVLDSKRTGAEGTLAWLRHCQAAAEAEAGAAT